MEPKTTQLRLLSINYESGLNEFILYDYDDHAGEILEILTELPESAIFGGITRIHRSLLGMRYCDSVQWQNDLEKQITKLKDQVDNYRADIKDKQIELDNTLDLLMEERESRKNIREHALDLESQIERLKIYKGADHDSPGC